MDEREPNLLSHITEVRKSYLPEEGVSCIIICGKMRTDADTASVLASHRKVVEEEVDREETNITGLLMAQGNSFLHLIEGPCNSVLSIISNLLESEQFYEPIIQSGRIVYNVEDRPCRYFQNWYSCVIHERVAHVDDINEESCIYVVHELAMKLFEVGKKISIEPPAEDLAFDKYADLLPTKNLVIELSNSSLFFTIEEYAQVFCDPLHITLESESTWPLERLVDY